MKIRPGGAELFQADGHTDGQTEKQSNMTKLIFAVRNVANASKNASIIDKFNHLHNKINPNYMSIFYLYRAVITTGLGCGNQYREIITVCSEIHVKHLNVLCGPNVDFFFNF